VFFSDITACQRCHVVNGEGIAIGPDLSQIGDKLGKDALLEAILDPNNGIAFGYEAWTVTTTDDEEIYGLIVSETADELAVKDLSGIVHRIAKARLADRVPSKFSLMPAGLQATMSVTELVDLVEYMSQLKKVPAP
jgi:putative heme-binding domain-containing protein